MAPIARQVRLSTKGQIVLPLDVRKRMGLRPGDRLVVVGEDHIATFMTPKRYAENLRGAASCPAVSFSWTTTFNG